VKILVTGASGFIGKWVVGELQMGEHETVAFTGDLRDKRTFPSDIFDVIIHLGARVDKRFWESDDLYKVNVEGTANLLVQYPDSKVIYISSADVEREILSRYASTKKETEGLVLVSPINLVIRPPSVFGPGDKHDKLIPRLFRKYREGADCKVLNNDENEHMYVEDLAKYIVSNIDKHGIIRPNGFRIRNLHIETMISAICHGEEMPELKSGEQEFFLFLERCLAGDRST
jgi:nucleoside-diphosphate-sugar epimerase